MTDQQFNIIINNRISSINTILKRKGEEYSTNDDRLHNFKVAARINNSTPEKALWGMATKHLISIIDLINGKNHTQNIIDEKIGDMINYLILLEAILKEKL